MNDYKVSVHFKKEPDYETFVSANSINTAKVAAVFLAQTKGFCGELSKQPTVTTL